MTLAENLIKLKREMPKGMSQKEVTNYLIEKMGSEESYRAALSEVKNEKYERLRKEEKEGLLAMSNGQFSTHRAYAYPVIPKIVKLLNGKYGIRHVTEFGSKERIFLTHKDGFNDPKNDFQNELIKQLKEDLKNKEVGSVVELSEGDAVVRYRITVEKHS